MLSRAAKMALNVTQNILWSETTKCYEIFNINIPQYIFYIRLIVGIPYVEQELHTLLENLNSFPVVSEVRVARSLAFCVMFCRQLFVILAFYFWLLYCLPFFVLRFTSLIDPLVSSNLSWDKDLRCITWL